MSYLMCHLMYHLMCLNNVSYLMSYLICRLMCVVIHVFVDDVSFNSLFNVYY
jgi:hypothetical protein